MFIIVRDPTIDLRFRPSSRPWTSRRETKYGLAEARPSEAMAAPAGFAAASRSRSRRLQAAGELHTRPPTRPRQLKGGLVAGLATTECAGVVGGKCSDIAWLDTRDLTDVWRERSGYRKRRRTPRHGTTGGCRQSSWTRHRRSTPSPCS